MKVLITETQSDIIRLRRYYRQVQDEFADRSFRYNPCDYNYEDGVYDYYNDVANMTVEHVIGNLFNLYYDDEEEDNDRFSVLAELLKDMLFESEFSNFEKDIQEYLYENCK